jgi:hypothetical protein
MSLAPFRAWEGGGPLVRRRPIQPRCGPQARRSNEVGGTGLIPNGNDVRRASTDAPERLVRQLAFRKRSLVGGCDGARSLVLFATGCLTVFGEDS